MLATGPWPFGQGNKNEPFRLTVQELVLAGEMLESWSFSSGEEKGFGV